MSEELIACPHCDAIMTEPDIEEGNKVMCTRCGGKIFERKVDSINRTFAISLAGLIIFIPAMTLPIMGIGAAGLFNDASLIDCITILLANGFYLIAVCLFIFTIAVPLVRLGSVFYITWCIKTERIPKSLTKFFSSFHVLDTWAMLHVFFLGVVVTMYKLLSLADLSIDSGLAAFLLLLMCSTAISVTLDHHLVWKKLDEHHDR